MKIGNIFEVVDDYSKWKRKNVTLRGIKQFGVDNNVYGSFGKGLYTVPLSNKAMAKTYGTVYFVVNAIPKQPKIVSSLNEAEIWRQTLVENFCKKHGQRYDVSFFEKHTSIEKEMLELGFDGLVIKGREMVNYRPNNVEYFETERQLVYYYENLNENINENLNKNDVVTFILDFGMFITMNLSKVTQEVNSSENTQHLNTMLSDLRKPLLNGMIYSEITNDINNIINNPKLLSALFSQIRNLLIYIKPRLEKFVKDGEKKTIWLNKINDFEMRYKNLIK